jgi:hypothetical protein
MGMYLSIPKILTHYPIGDLLEIWLHFTLFILSKKYLSSVVLHAISAELSSILYPSFIEGTGFGGNPYYFNDVIKFSVLYMIDMGFFISLPFEFI